MSKKIRFAYRIVIDSNSSLTWEKYVFEDTYREYLMQSQLFNNKENPVTTFRELLIENEKAEQLHFLVGMATNGYVQQLKGNLYSVADVLGNNYFPINGFKLDIVNSDTTDKTKHKVGITFFSKEMLLLDIINNYYLVTTEIEKQNNFSTIMFPVQSRLSICYLENM